MSIDAAELIALLRQVPGNPRISVAVRGRNLGTYKEFFPTNLYFMPNGFVTIACEGLEDYSDGRRLSLEAEDDDYLS